MTASVAAELLPRYHFAGGADYYERAPYLNHVADQPPRNVSRFLGVAPVNNAASVKWIYAFTVVPASRLDSVALAAIPANVTPSPYIAQPASRQPESGDGFFFAGGHGGRPQHDRNDPEARKRKREEGPPPEKYVCHKCKVPGHWIDDCPQHKSARMPGATSAGTGGGGGGGSGGGGGGPPESYVCHKCKVAGHWIQDCPLRKPAEPTRATPAQPPAPCWFCLSSPQVEKHLVVSVGTQVYLALAKGGLTSDHCLILPIEHSPCATALDQVCKSPCRHVQILMLTPDQLAGLL